MTRRNVNVTPKDPIPARVESLAHDGRGVARLDGKAVFIDGALPDEQVRFVYRAQRRHFDEGEMVEIVVPSPSRVQPRCPHFGVCGGCSLQHMDGAAQILSKQQVLLDNLGRIGGVEPDEVVPPMTGPLWGYRRRARLGAKYVPKKSSLLIGFREKRSSLIAELTRCEVLHPLIGERIQAMRALVEGLQARERIPQIEVAVADNATALIFRHLTPLVEADRARLLGFAQEQNFHVYLQAAGPDSVELLWPSVGELVYKLTDFDVELAFRPNDFIQVNGEINRRMVACAIDWLALTPQSRVLDLYCGLGNFTLPLARRAGSVVGVEGDLRLVRQGQENARRNGITNADFHVADLATDCRDASWARGQHYDRIMLDPPRVGAMEMMPLLGRLRAERIVYVSCDPATLARDAGELVKFGYRLRRAGVMDMFPHTTHVESIALFEL